MLAILGAAAATLALAPLFANAQLDSLRGTIPGSLHQCEVGRGTPYTASCYRLV